MTFDNYERRLKTIKYELKELRNVESDIEMTNIPSEDKAGFVEISSGWHIHEDIMVQAGSARTVIKRLGVLMSTLWSKDERQKRVMKKRRAPNFDDNGEITIGEMK